MLTLTWWHFLQAKSKNGNLASAYHHWDETKVILGIIKYSSMVREQV